MTTTSLLSKVIKINNDKGAIFCQVSRILNLTRFSPAATGGTQKCKGANPILRSTPTIQPNTTAPGVTPLYKSIREPMLCTMKYVIADFLLLRVGIAKGTNPKRFSSRPIHAIGQQLAPIVSNVPLITAAAMTITKI